MGNFLWLMKWLFGYSVGYTEVTTNSCLLFVGRIERLLVRLKDATAPLLPLRWRLMREAPICLVVEQVLRVPGTLWLVVLKNETLIDGYRQRSNVYLQMLIKCKWRMNKWFVGNNDLLQTTLTRCVRYSTISIKFRIEQSLPLKELCSLINIDE